MVFSLFVVGTEEGFSVQLRPQGIVGGRVGGLVGNQQWLATVAKPFDERFQGGVGVEGEAVADLGTVPVVGEGGVDLGQDDVEEETGVVEIEVDFEPVQGGGVGADLKDVVAGERFAQEHVAQLRF